jgi:hypothetical protein
VPSAPERLEFTAAAVPRLAAELGASCEPAPYRARGEPVYILHLHSQALRASVRLVLWPSLRRVDAYIGDRPPACFIVFKEIADLLVLPGVEVIFRRAGGGFLLVTSDGQVSCAS